MRRLMTIGYEKASLEEFVAALTVARVTTLLDVREIPLSRRKGFSKRALRDAVQLAGITYRHERSLGSPKSIREQLNADRDYKQYFKSFRKYLGSQQPLLESLSTELNGAVALMCYERDPTTCHRSVVARQLENLTGLTTKHLEVANGDDTKGARINSGKGLPAA